MKLQTRLKKHLKLMDDYNIYTINRDMEIKPNGRVSSYGKAGAILINFRGYKYKVLRSYKTIVALYDFKSHKYYYDNAYRVTTMGHIKAFINDDKIYYGLKKNKFINEYLGE